VESIDCGVFLQSDVLAVGSGFVAAGLYSIGVARLSQVDSGDDRLGLQSDRHQHRVDRSGTNINPLIVIHRLTSTLRPHERRRTSCTPISTTASDQRLLLCDSRRTAGVARLPALGRPLQIPASVRRLVVIVIVSRALYSLYIYIYVIR
jgi:hypothetical protein